MTDLNADPFRSFVDQGASWLDNLLDDLSKQAPQLSGFFGAVHQKVDAFETAFDSWSNLSTQPFGNASSASSEKINFASSATSPTTLMSPISEFFHLFGASK